MPTKSPSSCLFLTSSSPQHNATPEDEVQSLIEQARTVAHVDETIAKELSLKTKAFFNIFGRQVELIKSRSQAFEDCHVTVYDKVLLALTDNGNHLSHPAAIMYFCEEYFGIGYQDERTRAAQMFRDMITVKAPVTQGEDSQTNFLITLN